MKRVILIAAIVVALLTKVASAQVTASVDFSAAKFTNLAATNYLYGPTVSLSSTFLGRAAHPDFLSDPRRVSRGARNAMTAQSWARWSACGSSTLSPTSDS